MVFLPRTNFLANRSPVRGGVRANSGEPGRTPPNSGVRSDFGLRRTPANVRRSSAECRCWRTDGEFLTDDIRLPFSLGEKRKLRAVRGSGITATSEFARSSHEFARVRPSSREFAGNDSSPGILPRRVSYLIPLVKLYFFIVCSYVQF